MKKESWGHKGRSPSAHGWSEQHFFVHGKRVCNGIGNGKHIDLRGYVYLENRIPTFAKEKYWKKQDCCKCAKIWLELQHVFKDISFPNNRLFPEEEYLQNKKGVE